MNRTLFATAILTLGLMAGSPAALAQDGVDLPAICTADNPHAGMAMGSGEMGMATSADAEHTDLMDGMAAMNRDMMAGGTAKDIDVAFVCSMIPHHRGAIDMAKAELAHGDDPWARQLAEGIIAAQEKEIAEMLKWLEGVK
jgi:uncharacterized protein (DUF305 family)